MRTRALTGNARTVRNHADAVLDSGIAKTFKYTVANFGNQPACKDIVRSLQKSFAALRCMDRQRKVNRNGTTEVAEYSKYDDLACHIGDLPNGEGAYIRFELAVSLMHKVEVESDDGEATPGYGEAERLEVLIDQLLNSGPRGMSAADIELVRTKHGPIPQLGDKPEEWAMVDGELQVTKPAEFSQYKTWGEWKAAQEGDNA